MSPRILDLCSGTGAWSAPYRAAGYYVEQVDLPEDIRLKPALQYTRGRDEYGPIHGILAAPPCTVFSYARNRYEPSEEELREALSVVDACLRAVAIYQPVWWCLENPVNKLRRYLGPPRWTFRHWQYGDPAEKPTALWGNFTPPMFKPGARTKPSTFKTNKQNAEPWDAITPPNFARAFFEANP